MNWPSPSNDSWALLGNLSRTAQLKTSRRESLIAVVQALGATRDPGVLPKIAPYLFDADLHVAIATREAIEHLTAAFPSQLFLGLDAALRWAGYGTFDASGRPDLNPAQVSRLSPSVASAWTLGLLSCFHNGYVREVALIRLAAECTSGTEIPFLLLRLNEWIRGIHAAAERALRDRLTASLSSIFLHHVPLLVRLRKRGRAASSPVFAEIEKLLYAEAPALAGIACGAHDRATRYYALRLALDAMPSLEKEVRENIFQQLSENLEPGMHLQMARWLAQATGLPDLQERFFSAGLGHRFAAARRAALEWAATRDPLHYRPELYAALLDPVAAIRAIGQYHLPKCEPIELRAFYRAAVEQAHRLKPALGGLGEIGQAVDAELALPLMRHPCSGVRAAALATLEKLALSAHLEIFIEALKDPSVTVVRRAVMALKHHVPQIGTDRLLEIFRTLPGTSSRRQLLSLLNRLSKWPKVNALLEVLDVPEETLHATTHSYLSGWLGAFNRSQLDPSFSDFERFEQNVHRHGSRMTPWLREELDALVQQYAGRFAR